MPSPGMTLRQVRVVDPILTTIAQGYAQLDLVGNYLAPLVEVVQYGGQVIVFDKAAYRTYNSKRAPGTNTKRIRTNYGTTPYTLYLDALEHPVPIQFLDDAASTGVDWAQIAVDACMAGMTNNLEADQATLFRTAANYNSNNTVTLSGGSQLSTVTAPLGSVIRAGKEAIRAATGMYPNVWEISASVFAAIQELNEVKARLQYTTSDSVTTEMLGAWYGIPKVVIGASVTVDDNTDTMSDIWGKDMILAYTNPLAINGNRIAYSTNSRVNRFMPSAAYTYVMRGHPMAKPRYYDDNTESYIYGAKFDRAPVATGVDSSSKFTSAYLIRNAIA